MSEDIRKLLQDAEQARTEYRVGDITREECNARVAPYAEAYNVRAKELAREFGMKFKSFSTTSFLR